MRKKYSNQLFLCIQELGLKHSDFEIKSDIDHDITAKLIHLKNTPFDFIIRSDENSFDAFDYKFIEFAPNYPFSDYYPSDRFTDFDDVMIGFKDWIINHVNQYLEEEKEPDLWATFNSGNKSLEIDNINFDETIEFSKEEKRQVAMSINELRLLIKKEINTSNDEQIIIDNRLNYLIEAVERLNKYDWKGLVMSTFMGIVTTLTLDTDKGEVLFNLFKRVFNNLPPLLD